MGITLLRIKGRPESQGGEPKRGITGDIFTELTVWGMLTVGKGGSTTQTPKPEAQSQTHTSTQPLSSYGVAAQAGIHFQAFVTRPWEVARHIVRNCTLGTGVHFSVVIPQPGLPAHSFSKPRCTKTNRKSYLVSKGAAVANDKKYASTKKC